MKLKRLVGAFVLTLFVTSCSMGEMVIPDKEGGGLNSKVEGKSVIVTPSLILSGQQTKTSNPEAQKIGNVVVFLLAGNNVENVKVAESVDKVKDITFYTKIQEGKSLFAVTNVSKPVETALKACETLQAIKDISLGSADKASEAKASVAAVPLAFSPDYKDEDQDGVYTSDTPEVIEVTQRTAIIRLKGFNITFDQNSRKDVDVVITGVRFENINSAGKIEGEISGGNSYEDKPIAGNVMVCLAGSVLKNADLSSFAISSFQNTNTEAPVQMSISYKIKKDGVFTDEYTTRMFVINKPGTTENEPNYVNPNYIYNLTVNMAVSVHRVDVDLVCYTEDWIHHDWEIEEK